MDTLDSTDISERLQWLMRLRWVIVPIFVAVDLASDLLLGHSSWGALGMGAALLVANGLYSAFLARRRRASTLLLLARVESAVVVAIPVFMVLLHGDPSSPLRYGVLVGVVGAAVVLPRMAEVAAVGSWACASLVLGDVLALHGLSRVDHRLVARWAIDFGVIATTALISGYLNQLRERAEERLRLSLAHSERARQEWEATFDNLHELVFVTDLQGVVTRANRAFAAALGGQPPQVTGRRLETLLAGHPERWWSARDDGLVEIEDPIFDTLYELAISRLDDRVVRVARDVGEQRRLYARLVQADKLAAVGVLASGVAHEINNPTAFVTSNLSELRRYLQAYESAFSELTAIAMEAGRAERVSALLQRPEVGFARREGPAAINESLTGMERIRQIVTNLRSLARRDQAGEPVQPVSLAEVIAAVVRTAAPDLRAASARVDVDHNLWVMGHRGELVDVVLNLVVNAIQARAEDRPNQIVVELKREGNMAAIRVADTGQGIAPAHLKRLFEPFFTTKAPGQGTGLGLSLARNIAMAHGGTIDVATELGVGTTFTMRLPALDVDAVDAARLLRSHPRASNS